MKTSRVNTVKCYELTWSETVYHLTLKVRDDFVVKTRYRHCSLRLFPPNGRRLWTGSGCDLLGRRTPVNTVMNLRPV